MSDEGLFLETNVSVWLFDADAPKVRAITHAVLRDQAGIRLGTRVPQESVSVTGGSDQLAVRSLASAAGAASS